MYISSRIKIFSKVEKCHLFSNSSNWISNSRLSKSTVLCVEIFNMSETPIKRGLWFSITQPKGATEVSQAVKAYKASMVLSGETPGGKWITISTSAAVLSSIFLILIFPFSLAFRILSIKVEVFVENGIWVITKVCLSSWLIFARTLTRPPRIPSL